MNCSMEIYIIVKCILYCIVSKKNLTHFFASLRLFDNLFDQEMR